MDYTVRIIAMVTGNDDLKVKVTKWKQPADPDDRVRFTSLNASNVDVILKFESSPFKSGGPISVPENTTTAYYTVKSDADGSYKYAVTGEFSDGESFAVDPRFIIGGGEVTR